MSHRKFNTHGLEFHGTLNSRHILMILLNPGKLRPRYSDVRSGELMAKLIQFFENRGNDQLQEDYYARQWYSEFLEFVKDEQIFSTMCTPAGYGAGDSRWDTWRICEFAEILGFYGLPYWYAWQVSVLGLGPIWMSSNEQVKKEAAKALQEGGIFAFGLSEKAHGADIYSTDMIVSNNGESRYLANGSKYYIGNGNEAAITSTFGRFQDSDEYLFFAARSDHPCYELVKNVVASQNYVSEYRLNEYPLTDADILHRGQEAWNAALNTVNIGKYNLGWASIGICTHAFYEAIHHASYRRLYNMAVTDFPHVKRLFTDAYARLVAMKLFALRASDYMRTASAEDRRYLLFNPMTKMKVTTQGEEVINLMWDVIAAKGFEKDMYFTQAAVDIRALPKLEGTVHVNIALIVKFMPAYFFNPGSYPPVVTQDEPRNDDFLFKQGPARGLGKIQFHDWQGAFEGFDQPNVLLFLEQARAFRKLLATASPTPEQMKDIDFLLTGGEIFALVVYAQLILENASLLEIEGDLVDQIFDCLVRDMSHFALEMHNKPGSTEAQMAQCLAMIRKPAVDAARVSRVWQEHVYSQRDAYQMAR
jgi:acyl-CoA dehydrogenase